MNRFIGASFFNEYITSSFHSGSTSLAEELREIQNFHTSGECKILKIPADTRRRVVFYVGSVVLLRFCDLFLDRSSIVMLIAKKKSILEQHFYGSCQLLLTDLIFTLY